MFVGPQHLTWQSRAAIRFELVLQGLSRRISNRGTLRVTFLRDSVATFDRLFHALPQIPASTSFLANLRQPLVRLGDSKHPDGVGPDLEDHKSRHHSGA